MLQLLFDVLDEKGILIIIRIVRKTAYFENCGYHQNLLITFSLMSE